MAARVGEVSCLPVDPSSREVEREDRTLFNKLPHNVDGALKKKRKRKPTLLGDYRKRSQPSHSTESYDSSEEYYVSFSSESTDVDNVMGEVDNVVVDTDSDGSVSYHTPTKELPDLSNGLNHTHCRADLEVNVVASEPAAKRRKRRNTVRTLPLYVCNLVLGSSCVTSLNYDECEIT